MPVVPPNNNVLWSIDKQTDEATISSTADYSIAAWTATWAPRYDERRIEVLDGSSVQGDVSKGLGWWDGESEFPAYADSLGRILQSMWPTDTKTGAGPWTHTFSGLGGTQPWISTYLEWINAGAFEQTFGRGQATGFSITATADESPARVRFAAMGETATVANYSSTVPDDLLDGYFTLQTTGAKIELDFDTPNVNPAGAVTNVQSVTLNVDRNATPMPTADGLTVTNLSVGKVMPSGTMSLIYNSWDAFRATNYGSVAGTSSSPVVVTGALEVSFIHNLTAAWTLTFYMPAVQFKADAPVPNPAGEGIIVPVTLNIQKPASGDHVQPILINNTTLAY